MKPHQFYGLLSAVYFSSVVDTWVNVTLGIACFIAAVIYCYVEVTK